MQVSAERSRLLLHHVLLGRFFVNKPAERAVQPAHLMSKPANLPCAMPVALVANKSIRTTRSPQFSRPRTKGLFTKWTIMARPVHFPVSFVLGLFLLLLTRSGVAYGRRNLTQCRYIPGDPGWPSAVAWHELNATVGGRLIATVPLAAPCHEPHFDAQRCAFLKGQWGLAPVQ
jgi:hypothetical protein